MPIYDYVCSNCRHRIEVIHGIHDEGPRFCPSCGFEGTMRKALSTPAVHFKGSGWAKKDRSSTSSARTKAAAAGASGSSASAGSSGDAASSESKGGASEAPGSSADHSASKED